MKAIMPYLVGAAVLTLLLMQAACGSQKSPDSAATATPQQPIGTATTPPGTGQQTDGGAQNTPTAGEEWPNTVVAAPSGQENVPLVSGANLLLTVIDEQGMPVPVGVVEYSVVYTNIPGRNRTSEVKPASFHDGLLPVYPPPAHIPATVSLRVVTPGGRTSDTLVVRNDEYWQAFAPNEVDFVVVHEFDLSKTEQTTKLKLITIDINSGSETSAINLSSDVFIPVAILTTPLFDAADVDQTSLTLQGVVTRVKGNGVDNGSLEDVGGDGDLDLVVHFPTADLQLTAADTAAILEGTTLDGTPLQGVGSISIVP